MKDALSGLRVLDFTRFVAGPWATTLLGDFGADVIKIESPETGDGSRMLDDVFGVGMSSYFVGLNRGKRSLAIDLKLPQSREAIRRLSKTSDVIVTNFRPGVMERLGLGYDDLSAENPRLIYLSITAFGEAGPLAKEPAMDIIVQALGGIMGLTGERGRPPVKVGAPIADFVGSYIALSAITLGLYVRSAQGIGQKIEVNLLDGQVSMLANFIPGHARTGAPEGPQGGGHPQIVPYQVFATADQSIVIGCLTQNFWRSLCQVIGREDLINDSRFVTNPARVKNRDALVPILEPIFAGGSSADWLCKLGHKGVPCSRVASIADVTSSAQVQLNGMLVNAQHPDIGPVQLAGNPLHLRATPPRHGRAAPRLGEHSIEVLAATGYTPAQIANILNEEVRSGNSEGDIP